MTLLEIKEVLEECRIIDGISVLNPSSFKGINYDLVFKGMMTVDEQNRLPIIICIPKKWYLDLIDIYIDYLDDIIYLPHVDRKGKLCLFETEGVLIEQNLRGILVQSIFRAKSILKAGLLQENSDDFLDEFELYWSQLVGGRVVSFDVPIQEISQNVKCTFEVATQRKKEKQVKYLQRKDASRMYIGKDSESIKRWNLKNTSLINAAYFVVNPPNKIYPPDIRKPLSLDYLNNLLQMVPEKDVYALLSGLRKSKVIVFAIKQPIGITNYFGFFAKGGDLQKSEGGYILVNVEQMQPLVINRADKKYLMKRTTDTELDISKKKILVVGCGSIGGHLICELAKAGYEDITVVDDDILTEENVFRHILGMEYVSQYKCEALGAYIHKNIPEVLIRPLVERLEDAVLEEDINLKEYNMLISATGNHNLNRWINAFVMEQEIDIPVIYAWNEVCGIGNHVAYFRYGNDGCYECLFRRDEETGEMYDGSSYCAHGQKITQNAGGCGKNYIPYGNTISVKTVLMCLDIIKMVFENRVVDNLLISAKGDDNYFIKFGLKKSERYLNQQESIKKLLGNQIVNKKCGVCNDCGRIR